jgi:hypothetical protein
MVKPIFVYESFYYKNFEMNEWIFEGLLIAFLGKESDESKKTNLGSQRGA